MNFSNKKSILLLVLFLLVLSFLLYHSTIFFPPSFIHAWTQSERYAISLQFLNNGFDIFHPATFNQQTVDGITRMDLPLNEFVVAILMKVFGTTSPFIFRAYMLCVSIVGLTFLYLLAKKITTSEFKSWIVVAFVFLSPLYSYYQAGFIPCVPAIAFVFIAYYFLYTYKAGKNRKHFYISIFFFFLAAMIRFPFFVFLFGLLLQQIYWAFKQKKIIRHELVGFLVAFGFFIGYYFYNRHLGNLYGNMFLDRFLPAKSFSELVIIIKFIYQHWLLQYFSFWHYVLLFISIVSTILFYRKYGWLENKAMWFNLFIVAGGAVFYFLLMACQYFDHDYYFLDSLFVPVVLFFLYSIKNVALEMESKKLVFFFIASVCSIFMYGDSRKNQFERYAFSSGDKVEISRRNFEGSESFLDSIGISKDAKMLVIDAYSTNIPLYMMNRKGYTIYQTNRDNPLVFLFQKKWDYVVIQDQFLFSDVLKYYPVIASVIEPIAGNGKIMVYKRSTHPKKRSVEELLQLDKKKLLMEEMNDFEVNQNGHFTTTDNILFSEQYSKYTILDSVNEYGISFKVGANELKDKSSVSVKVSLDFLSSDLSGIKIVATTANESKTLHYQSYALSDFYQGDEIRQKGIFYFTLPEFYNANDILSVYLWNPDKKLLQYDNFKVAVYSNL